MTILRPNPTLTRVAARVGSDPSGLAAATFNGGSRVERSATRPNGQAQLLLEALATGDTTELDRAVTDDVHGRTPSFRCHDLAGLRRGIGEPAGGFGSVLVSLGCIGCGEGVFLAEWEVEARHTGAIAAGWAELEPTGRVVRVEGAMVGRRKAELISSFSLYHDEISLLEQLQLL